MTRDCILDRIDAALEKMRFAGMQVRAIYLTDKDRDAFSRAMSARHKAETGRKRYFAHYCSYGDHHIRPGKTNAIYSTHGVATVIPKRLSPRVEDRIAA